MTDEEKEAIEYWKGQTELYSKEDRPYKFLRTLLNLIEKQDNTIKGNECVIETMAHNEEVLLETIEKKDKIIDDTIIAVENLRQYFSEDLQPDFIIILEILKNKKVIDW